MPKIQIGSFVMVAPHGGYYYVGEVTEIKTKDGRTSVFCEWWYCTVTKNRVRKAGFYVEVLELITPAIFYIAISHHVPGRVI